MVLDPTLDALGVAAPQLIKVVVACVIVYVAAIVLLRIGKTRALGKNTALDIIIGFVLGSILSRAINGGADLVPLLAAGFVLEMLHAGTARLALRNPRFGTLGAAVRSSSARGRSMRGPCAGIT